MPEYLNNHLHIFPSMFLSDCWTECHLLDVGVDGVGQVEEPLEAVQDSEGIAGGVGTVLPSQYVLEEILGCVVRTCQGRVSSYIVQNTIVKSVNALTMPRTL